MGSIFENVDTRDATTKSDQFATSTKFPEDFSDVLSQPLENFRKDFLIG